MDQGFTERRKAVRRRVLKGGTMSFRGLGTSLACTVRNLSDAGALLLVKGPVGIPNEFELVIDSDHLVRPCAVAWRSGERIGVAFQ